MGRKTWRHGFLPFLILVAALADAAGSAAASFELTDKDREQAIRAGKKSVVSDEFGGEWRVQDAGGQGLVVMTPFYRLAIAARNQAFRGGELNPREIESLLKDYTGHVSFWATLRGAKADFARFYTPTLQAGATEVKASFVQNERTALREDDGRYAARCLWVFPAEGIDPKSRVTLVVRDADEKEVAKFTVDLAAMR